MPYISFESLSRAQIATKGLTGAKRSNGRPMLGFVGNFIRVMFCARPLACSRIRGYMTSRTPQASCRSQCETR